MPETFQFPTRQAEIWTPMLIDTSRVDRGEVGAAMIARLAPSATLVQARTELAASVQALRQDAAMRTPDGRGTSCLSATGTLARISDKRSGF